MGQQARISGPGEQFGGRQVPGGQATGSAGIFWTSSARATATATAARGRRVRWIARCEWGAAEPADIGTAPGFE
jgi:hypothetical protein